MEIILLGRIRDEVQFIFGQKEDHTIAPIKIKIDDVGIVIEMGHGDILWKTHEK